ncbi:MAG: protein kinase [Holophagales bacterium]|nr:protein kinase [Holophagales bacterium]
MKSGTRLGPYEIVASLGAGGMGEVFHARDTRLGRDIAIKVLPSEFAENAERLRRFEQEARATAALNHPNVLAIYDVGSTVPSPADAGGATPGHGPTVHFLVEELLVGRTLRDLLGDGTLPRKDAVGYGIQAASGLAAAHGKGIVHRDLKPENLFVTSDGVLKVLDFGLARVLWRDVPAGPISAAATATAKTVDGVVLGTVGYMSPEQVRGMPCDHRADVFAFGCVLYEMLAGQRAFRGETPMDTMSAILSREPPPISGLGRDVPPALQAIVERCLEKDPAKRYQSAAEVRSALEVVQSGVVSSGDLPGAARRRSRLAVAALAVAAAAVVGTVALVRVRSAPPGGSAPARRAPAAVPASPATAPRTIAVLPFASVPATDETFDADALQDGIIRSLARFEGLRVISRASTASFRGTTKKTTEVATSLGADELVRGTVERAGSRLRVELALFRVVPEVTKVWSETYDRDASDVFRLQDEIAAAVAAHVDARLAGSATPTPARKVDPVIYELYLKGKFQVGKGTEEGYRKGVALLREANERDPSDPLPYAALSIAYVELAHSPWGKPELLEIAAASAKKAISIDPDLPEGYAASALSKQYGDWDWHGLEQDYRKALALNPSLAEIRRHYAWYLMMQKRGAEALAEMRRARADDPLGSVYYSDLGWLLQIQGRYDEALAEARRSVQLEPEGGNNLLVLGLVLASKGMFEEAVEVHRKLAKVDPSLAWALAHTLVVAGREQEALPLIERMRKTADAMSAFGLGWVYAAKGDKDEALRWLEIARQQHQIWTPWIGLNVELAALRGDPRFVALLGKIGVPNVEPDFGKPRT